MRTHPSPRRARHLVAAALGFAAFVGVVGPVDAARPRPTSRVVVRVTDQDGIALRRASVMACPYAGVVADCDDAVTVGADRRGVARLTLDRGVRYELTAFVRDPRPPWACPGFEIGGVDFYFSAPLSARPADVPRRQPLVVERPSAFDCIPVTVTDDEGTALPTAGLFVCPLGPDGTPCGGPTFDGPDADGVIRLPVDPAVTYRLSAFVVNTGWPCPAFVNDAGSFHFSPERDVLGADLLGGTTFVIRRPTVDDCAPTIPPDTTTTTTTTTTTAPTTTTTTVLREPVDGHR